MALARDMTIIHITTNTMTQTKDKKYSRLNTWCRFMTEDRYSWVTKRTVMEFIEEGYSDNQIMEELDMDRATYHIYKMLVEEEIEARQKLQRH